MASQSQASFATRLSKGKKLYQLLNSFPGYAPDVPEFAPQTFKAMLEAMTVAQAQHTEAHHSFAEAAKQRRIVFSENPNSLLKTITLINAYIRGKFQKDSQIYADVNSLVKKIRGEKPVRITRDADTEMISRSEKSYGSQAEYLGDLITLATQLGADYTPTNSAIKLAKLKELHAQILQLNDQASVKLAAFKPKVVERQNNFEQLNTTAKRIKDMVKAQYGVDSIEHKLVKGLSF